MARASAKGACGYCCGTWTCSWPPLLPPTVSEPASVLLLLGGREVLLRSTEDIVERGGVKRNPRWVSSGHVKIGLSQTSVSPCRKWEHKNWPLRGWLVEVGGVVCRAIVAEELPSHGDRQRDPRGKGSWAEKSLAAQTLGPFISSWTLFLFPGQPQENSISWIPGVYAPGGATGCLLAYPSWQWPQWG